MPDEPDPLYRKLSCPNCGAQCRCAERHFSDRPGYNVTLWCDGCKRLFDFRIPLE